MEYLDLDAVPGKCPPLMSLKPAILIWIEKYNDDMMLKCPISKKTIEKPLMSSSGIFYDEESVRVYFSEQDYLEENGQKLNSKYRY